MLLIVLIYFYTINLKLKKLVTGVTTRLQLESWVGNVFLRWKEGLKGVILLRMR